MMKKIFKSPWFFIITFAAVSIAADSFYHHQLTYRDPAKKGWTCWCDFKVFWTAGYRMSNYAFPPTGGGDVKPASGATYSAGYGGGLENFIGGNKSLVYDRSEPFYHFRYAPATAFFMAPFALIAYPADALIVWFIILNIALITSLLLLVRQMRLDFKISRGMQCAILWSAFIMTSRFYLLNISNGQCDVIIALFLALFLIAYVRGNEIACGIIFALIIQFKPQFAPMLLYFLLSGRWKMVLAAFFGSLALLFAPAAIIGFGKTAALLKDWAGITGLSVSSQLLNAKNQSITYFIGKALLGTGAFPSSISASSLFYALSAVFTLSSYAALLIFRKAPKAAESKKFKYAEISILIMTTLLFSPLVWTANFIYLIIPVGAMALFLLNSGNRKPAYIALAGFFILSMVVGTDITKFIPGINKIRSVNIALGVICLAYALIYSYRHEAPE